MNRTPEGFNIMKSANLLVNSLRSFLMLANHANSGINPLIKDFLKLATERDLYNHGVYNVCLAMLLGFFNNSDKHNYVN